MTLPQSSTTSVFWEACKNRQLLLRYCNACSKPFYYPRTGCPACGSEDLAWRSSAGTGTVYTHTRVEMALGAPSWEAEIPYTVILVDLDEGVRMPSRLVGPHSDSVKIGDRVKVEFVEREGQALPYFVLNSDSLTDAI